MVTRRKNIFTLRVGEIRNALAANLLEVDSTVGNLYLYVEKPGYHGGSRDETSELF